MTGPIRLEPVYLKSIWAGNRLGEIRGLKSPGTGISREVCTYPGSENRVCNGPFVGQKITELIRERREEIMGNDPERQMVRVAFMDTAEDLSIQVHPDGAMAEAEGDFEKSESWYILEAAEGAYVTAGLREMDKERIREAIREDRLEELLVRLPVKTGDFVMIPAGMVHACGKGLLALEVGSFGGITYRLYDYGRGRRLNLEEGLLALKPQLKAGIDHPEPEAYNHPVKVGRHPLFQVDLVDVRGSWTYGGYESYRILTCVEGECRVYRMGEEFLLSYTETIVIPAACLPIRVEGSARLLISYRC